ncbi:MFS transporter [Streptomyces sp. NPDC050560]|uniref:MFS transporter n=1 Tax=Streptomyces sp. NPDC050560 TaxID=3365630 RepID=UPI0037B11383
MTDTPVLTTYRELLAAPGARRLTAASLVSKFPVSMFPVTAVLLLSPRYSYAAAGAAVSALLVATAVSNPLRARLLSRYSVSVVLRFCLVGYLTGLAGLALSAAAHLPYVLVVLSAAVTGVCFPPVSMLLRGAWTAVAGARRRSSSNSLEAALMDVSLIAGPVLAAWLSTGATPLLPFAVIGACMGAAVALILTARQKAPVRGGSGTGAGGGGRGRGRPVPLRSRSLAAVYGAQLLFCAALSGVEVALPVFAQQHHAGGYSGWFLAALSVGSIVGALLLGAAPTLDRGGLPVLLGTFVAGACLLGLAMGAAPLAVLLVCPVTGLAVGSTFSRLYTVIAVCTPPGDENEAQGWAASMATVGFAVGSSAGAALAGAHGAPAFLFFSPVAGAAAALCALGARGGAALPVRPDGRSDAPTPSA